MVLTTPMEAGRLTDAIDFGDLRRALLVSTATPYPVVTNGCARLVDDYQRNMFPEHDVWFLLTHDRSPFQLFHEGEPVALGPDVGDLLDYGFEFVFFLGYNDNDFTRALASALSSFCLTDTFPHPDVPEDLFRGILSHRCDIAGLPNVFLLSGSYDADVFRPDRTAEDFAVCVGRLHPDKRQLDLVASWRDSVYEPFGLPLRLVGGVEDEAYYRQVARYLDGTAVGSTVDDSHPEADGNWRSAIDIAELCNRARLFVSASPQESFGMALIEAMACGTTCIVNGNYRGFAEADLGPHVHGNITGARGPVTELVAKALADDVRIDGSAWARKFSIQSIRSGVGTFIDERL